MFQVIIDILYAVFFALFCLFMLIGIVSFFAFMVRFIKGDRLKKRTVKSQYKKRNVFIRLFWDLPRALVSDLYSRDPDCLPLHGLFMFCGAQGSGKTIAAVEMLLRYLKMYPKIKIRSNIGIKFQHGKIHGWRDIVGVHNGAIGQIDFIDEIQNSFASTEFKNFPPEMLEEITQERKKHKVIVATAQVFTRVSKALREQTTYLCLPFTVMGCLTVVRIYKPILDDSGSLKDKKLVKVYFFVHNKELRESYNTYEKVERLKEHGFVERSEQLRKD